MLILPALVTLGVAAWIVHEVIADLIADYRKRRRVGLSSRCGDLFWLAVAACTAATAIHSLIP